MAKAKPTNPVVDALKIWGPVALIVLSGFLFAAKYVEPPAPKRIAIAAGARDGAYYHFAQLYKEELAKDGVEVTVLETKGSLDNCERIQAGDGTVLGFVQGGTARAEDWPGLEVLASLYYEPLWVFYREAAFGEQGLRVLTGLRGRKVAVGPQKSGTRTMAIEILGRSGVRPENATLLPYDKGEAFEALKAGTIDAAFVVAGPKAEVVTRLLEAEDIGLMSFQRHVAYARQLDFLRAVRLPEAIVDLARGIPAEDVILLAATAALVGKQGDPAEGGIHPAIVELCVKAARRIHAQGGLLEERDEFPSTAWSRDFPVNETAERILTSGDSFLSRVLPFWAVNLIRRFKVLLLPLLTLLLPLAKIAPAVFRWRMNTKVFRWYKVLQAVEDDVEDPRCSEAALAEACDKLRALDRELQEVRVPQTFMKDVYNLRMHIGMVRRDVEARLSGPRPDPLSA